MCVEDVGKSSETVSAQLSGNWKPWVSTVQLQLMHSAKQATSKALWSSSLRDPNGDRHRGTAAPRHWKPTAQRCREDQETWSILKR